MGCGGPSKPVEPAYDPDVSNSGMPPHAFDGGKDTSNSGTPPPKSQGKAAANKARDKDARKAASSLLAKEKNGGAPPVPMMERPPYTQLDLRIQNRFLALPTPEAVQCAAHT